MPLLAREVNTVLLLSRLAVSVDVRVFVESKLALCKLVCFIESFTATAAC